MSAKQRTDMVVSLAAGTSVAAAVANAPIIAAVAAALAAYWTARERDGRAVARLGSASSPGFPTTVGGWISSNSMAFHGFEGDDALLHDVPDDDDPDEDPRSETEQVVDHLTANLEADDNISFLPPYASGQSRGGVEQTDGEPLAILWEPPPDSSLLALLNDVLEPSSKMPMPRRFALGTVGILRNFLQPADVERILLEQRRYPRLRFGDVAVQLGFLSEDELGELLAAQEEGVFSDEEIIDTKARLEAYHLESERRESA